MRANCVRYVRAMCVLCACFVRAECVLCARCVRAMCVLCACCVRAMCYVRAICVLGECYVRARCVLCAFSVQAMCVLCACFDASANSVNQKSFPSWGHAGLMDSQMMILQHSTSSSVFPVAFCVLTWFSKFFYSPYDQFVWGAFPLKV